MAARRGSSWDEWDSHSCSSDIASDRSCDSSDYESYTSTTDDSYVPIGESIGHMFSSMIRRRGKRPKDVFEQHRESVDIEIIARRSEGAYGKKSVLRKGSWVPLVGCLSTYFLVFCFFFWISLVFLRLPFDPSQKARYTTRMRRKDPPSFTDRLRNSFTNAMVKPNVEEMKAGCEAAKWQTYNFPNCNELHEVDLISIRRRTRPADEKLHPLGYLASGLWRSVWAVDSRLESEVTVIKMMEMKHKLDDRNFDRHRRDALVMERLTSSSHVVDVHGYCGNSVITEFIATPLDDLVQGNNHFTSLVANSTNDRMKLALGVARGLQAMHEIPGGPIIHADVQAKQFLVTASGQVKVNDFNRCRFMGHDKDNVPCKVRIPSSPGKARSPEEYKSRELDEKLDVFSMGNVFYRILTGSAPWEQVSLTEAKRNIKYGRKPIIDVNCRKSGTLDAQLAEITERAFENDPMQRPSAKTLADEMEALLLQLTGTAL